MGTKKSRWIWERPKDGDSKYSEAKISIKVTSKQLTNWLNGGIIY